MRYHRPEEREESATSSEQQPREASLDVEATQIEREPRGHLPERRDVIGAVNSAMRSVAM